MEVTSHAILDRPNASHCVFVYSAFNNCFSDNEDDSKDATDIKQLIGGHHLRYQQPVTRNFPHNPNRTLPEVKKPYPSGPVCE